MENGWDRGTILTIALAALFALLIGFAVGFVTTFTHRQAPPWGLVGGLVVIAALVAGFRLVFDSRIIAAAAGLGAILATAVLMLPGAGGRAFVIDDPLGYVWALAPTALTAAIVLWPRRGRSRMEA
jgi:N-acetyl-1-D-myo-inositol-2-amino-2-deoxy-alpha-D-glucopyranoside deacetylase